MSCPIEKSFGTFEWYSEISQKLFDTLDSTAMAFDLTDGVVSAIWVVTNPEKLTRIDTPVILA